MGLSPVSLEKKWKIIAYHKINYSRSKIADLCDVSRTSVNTTINNLLETGDVIDKPRSGRP